MDFKKTLMEEFPDKKIVFSDAVNFNLTRHTEYDLLLVTNDGPRSVHYVLTQYLKENNQLNLCSLIKCLTKMQFVAENLLDLKITGDRIFVSDGRLKCLNPCLQIESVGNGELEIYENGKLVYVFTLDQSFTCTTFLEDYNLVSMVIIYKK